MAHWPVVIYADVAYVAGATVGPAIDCPVADDAAADTRADLDGQERLQPAPRPGPLLANGHDVDVVVHHHPRRWEAALHERLDGEPFPQGHERGGNEHARSELHRPGHADADSHHLGGIAAAPRQQVGDQLGHAPQELIRAGAHVGRLGTLLQDAPAKVGQSDIYAGRADVYADDVAQAGINVEQVGTATAGRFAFPYLGEDTGGDQAAGNGGDAGAGVVEAFRQVGAREGAIAADGGNDGRFCRLQRQSSRATGACA